MKEKQSLIKLSQIYAIGVLAYIVLIVIACVSMGSSVIQIVTNFWTSNSLASQTNTVFVSASRVLWSVELRWITVSLLLLAIITPVIYLWLFYSNQLKKLKKFYKTLVDTDWAINSVSILLVISLLAGLQDLVTLVFVATLSLLGFSLIGAAKSKYKSESVLSKKLLHTGIFINLLPWLLVAVYSVGTISYGMLRSPWYTYLLYFVGLVNIASLIVSYCWLGSPKYKKFLTDSNYTIAIQTIKILFVIILIIGLKR